MIRSYIKHGDDCINFVRAVSNIFKIYKGMIVIDIFLL